MLPSMPILFTRESQDAFGNKIEPSTSYFNQNYFQKPPILPEPPPPPPPPPPPTAPDPPKPLTKKETKGKGTGKKKTQIKENPLKINDSALEAALVKNFFTKVQSRFSSHSNLPTNKFRMFEAMLKGYDPTKETPVQLYKKIEELFGEEHKDLVEEFLLFLKPGQAAQVGRFMDHFMLVQMRGFIELLHSTFGRKPTVLRKIIRSLTAGINSGSCEEMKTKVLPHLRSNPRLIQMFKSLIPDERPPDSWYESDVEILNENFLTNDSLCESWELEEPNDNKKKLDATVGLSTAYLNGRLFLQHGRMLRSARVTFPYSKEPYRDHARRLAPNQSHLSPPQSDEEQPSPKRTTKITTKIPTKKNKKQIKSPIKKDVNGNTNKDNVNAKTVRKKTKVCPKKEDSKEPTQKKKIETKSQIKKDEIKDVKEIKNVVTTVEVDKDRKPEIKGIWTREEDKTMLQVLKGEAGSEEVFGKIRQLLPHKSVSEIKERFFHVMNLLQQMAVGEVT